MKYGGLIELLVVLMFAVGWGVLELVILRADQRATRGMRKGSKHCTQGDRNRSNERLS